MAAAVWAAPVSFTRDDARLAYDTAARFVAECTPRDAGTKEGRRAAEWICSAAKKAGAAANVDRFFALDRGNLLSFANVTAEFPGTDTNADWVVFISHFDTMPGIGGGFQGANDGASTTGLLVALAGVVRRAGRARENVMLAWTDAEERIPSYGRREGFYGSRRLVDRLAAKKRKVKAAVCLDMLGDRDLLIFVPGNGTQSLRLLAQRAASDAGVPHALSLRDALIVSDDHTPFLEAGCPAVDLIDFDYGSLPGLNNYWHTPLDTIDKISPESLHVSGRIAAAMLNLLAAPADR